MVNKREYPQTGSPGRKEFLLEYGLLRDLMRYIPDVIYFKDTSGRLLMVNYAHAKGLGLKPEQVVGKTDLDIFPKAKARLMAKDDRYVMATGKAIIDKIERNTSLFGRDNYVSTTKIPRYDTAGNIIGLIGITRDITRRMQLEKLQKEKESIEKRLQGLEELNRIKSEFISIVSHELRTPLAIIKEAVSLLGDEICGSINEKQKDILAKARNNIERLKRIINDLLDVSRIEYGKLKLHYSLVNFNEIVKEVVESFRSFAQDKGIKLEAALMDSPVYLFVDSHRIIQVLSNLIGNALKFTEEGGEVRLELKVLEDKIRVGVIDTGIGIAKKDLEKLFNKFTQVSGIASAQRKGLGLGLAIAKELVLSHAGEIWVESQAGIGSKFYFTLPRFPNIDIFTDTIRKKINTLLSKNVPLYFVSLLAMKIPEGRIKNDRNFKDVFLGIEPVIKNFFREQYAKNKEKPELFMSKSRVKGYSLILPVVNQEKADNSLKKIINNIKIYFNKNGFKNIFINAGLMAYTEKIEIPGKQSWNANFSSKSIFIGSEIRKFKRVNYVMNIQLGLKGRKISVETIDISCGGIRFYSQEPLKTDSQVEVTLNFPRQGCSFCLEAEIRWIRDLRLGNVKRYMIGLEFMGLSQAKKRKLCSGILALK